MLFGVNSRLPYDHALQVLSEDECLFLLCSRDLGRIVFDARGRLQVFPVNYAMEGRIVVFRTAPGTKLDSVPNSQVAFEVDNWDPELGIGWSVVVRGRAEEVSQHPGRTAEHIRRASVQPVAPGEHSHWLAIMPEEISGRRFHVRQPRHSRL
jgi:uncharacterized protein